MRFLPPLVGLVALAGCAGYSPLPGKAPAGASATMYTSTSAQQVAACIAQAVSGNAQADDAGYVIAGSSGTSYMVGPNQGRSVYPVRVVVRGEVVPIEESERTALCLRKDGRTS